MLARLASRCILCVPTPTSEAACDLSKARVFGHVGPVRSACVTALNWSVCRGFCGWKETSLFQMLEDRFAVCRRPGYESEARRRIRGRTRRPGDCLTFWMTFRCDVCVALDQA